MAQKHNAEYTEKPMTRDGRIQGPSRRYRRLRHPTFPAAEWTAKNPLLQRGEIGIESDTHKIKVGDGTTYWNNLAYSQDDGQPKSTADYNMGNSSGGWTAMSTAQQDALNSGATTTNITQIGTNTTTIGNHIANTSNPHNVTATQVGLGNVDNTSDADKPISTATQDALDLKANIADLGTAAYTDSTDYATAAQGAKADTAVQPGDLATVATTGSYNDLLNKPTIGDGVLTIQKNGTTVDTFTANAASNVTMNITVPTTPADIGAQSEITASNKLNADLVDDSTSTNKFVTASDITTWNGKQDALTAGTNINITGTTISATDTTYTGSDGVTLTGTNFTNSGVRAVASGTANGTISVNTNGTSADVSVTGLGSAAYTSSSDYATSAQGGKADTAVQPGDLATVATSGLYSDLSGTPTIPTVNDSTITITQGGVTKGSFTLNQASGDTIALDAGGSGLPDQTGNAGKFLTTDGTDASWSDKPLVNTATGTNALTILGTASTKPYSLNIGYQSSVSSNNGVAIGYHATSSGGGTNIGRYSSSSSYGSAFGNYATATGTGSVAIGTEAKATATGTIQINTSPTAMTNSDANTFKVANANGNFEIMSADGTIPEARLASTASAAQGQVLALDSNLDGVWTTLSIPAAQVNSDWNANSGVAEILNKPTTLSGYGITDGADTNLSNITNTGKEVCGHMAMPSGTRANLTFGASGTSYTAPGDGYFVIEMTATSSSSYCTVVKGTYHIADYGGNLGIYNMIIPASKGQQITISYDNCSIFWFYFEYTNGAA